MTDIDYGPKEGHAAVPGTDAEMFIQWKGTDVCMDFECSCGHGNHYDGFFAQFVQCSSCNAVFQLGTQVRAFRLEGREPFMEPLKDVANDD